MQDVNINIKIFERGFNKAKSYYHDLGIPIIFSYSIECKQKDILCLLANNKENKFSVYWDQPSEGFCLAGLGCAFDFEIKKQNNFIKMNKTLFKTLENSVNISEEISIGPRFFGGHAFNLNLQRDVVWEEMGSGRFFLPECIATNKLDRTWLTISALIDETINFKEALNFFSQKLFSYKNKLCQKLPLIKNTSVNEYVNFPSKDSYNDIVLSALDKIRKGIIKKIVLSRTHKIKVDQNFDVLSAVQILRNSFPTCTNFLFKFFNNTFFGSTPERLVKKNNSIINTEALAGTIRRGKDKKEDTWLVQNFLNNCKEKQEHSFVSRQLKEKLEKILINLEISSVPEIKKLKNLQHLRTPIKGKLNRDMSILDLVQLLHPTAAVAGIPSEDAIFIIDKLEPFDRGWYSGPIGWIDFNGGGDFFVALRSALVKDNVAHLFAGGGIVSESIPLEEWLETELKLKTIISTLNID